MSHKLLYWPDPYFYAIGNTPAVCLTQHLAPEEPAEVLLLGCGDPRSILFTNYSRGNSATSDLDFTCCDIDSAILARNVLLLTLLSDDVTGSNNVLIWNVFYHLNLDQASLSLLLEQCKKLVDLSESAEQWSDGPYNSFLRMCTRHTLTQLRRHWVAYSDSGQLTNEQKERLKGTFAAAMEGTRAKSRSAALAGALSAGPLHGQASSATLEEFTHYWKSGITSTNPKDITAATIPNPTLCRSISRDALALHYGSDPLHGYHISTAFAPLKSRSKTTQGTREGFGHAVNAAQRELAEWAKALRDTLANGRHKTVIRFFSGDAMDFCKALADCRTSMSTETKYFTRPWAAHRLVLDGGDYHQGAVSKAPLMFNVVDTSNLAHHLGILNVLIHARPLLVRSPSSTLYTEIALDASDSPIKPFIQRMCGDVPTISLLFDLLPWTYATNFNTHSNTHEVTLASLLSTTAGSHARFHERMAWKFISLGDPVAVGSSLLSGVTLKYDPLQLAQLMFNVYHEMFRPEESMMDVNLMHYTRGTFVLLLRLIKDHVQTDWGQFMDFLIGLIERDTSLMLGLNNYQEFIAQLHMAGVLTLDILLNYRQVPGIQPGVGIFKGWEKIPPVVCVLFSVPRSSVKRLQGMVSPGSLFFHCDVQTPEAQNRYSCIRPAFGIIKKGDDGRILLESDPEGWAGASPLVLSFLVPSWTLMVRPHDITIALGVHPVGQQYPELARKMGIHLHLFSAKLFGDSVNLSPEWPNIPSTLEPESAQATSLSGTGPSQSTGGLVDVSPVSVNLDKPCKKVETLTARVDLVGEIPKQELLGGAAVTATQVSPCTMLLKFGTTEQSLIFPFPINGGEARTRIARKSSYIEVIAPISGPLDAGGFSTKKFPVFSTDRQPKCWNIPYLNMDRLPVLDVSKPVELDWLPSHIGLTFSDRELVIREKETHIGEDWLVDAKESIENIIIYFAGLQGMKKRDTFGLQGPDQKVSVIIFATGLRLDLGSQTVVMDCCVMPLSTRIASDALDAALSNLFDAGLQVMNTSAEELTAWRDLLPAFVERCRTWEHSATACEYKANGVPASTDPNESPLCSCPVGNYSPEFLKKPTWRPFAKFVARAALSPLFAVSYLEPVGYTRVMEHAAGPLSNPKGCLSCRKEGKLLLCGRCKQASYCSAVCQKKHWSQHKKACKKPDAAE